MHWGRMGGCGIRQGVVRIGAALQAGRSDARHADLVLRLGELALLFHSSELYSYYGLRIRRDSPFKKTLVVGYTDDIIGYLVDPLRMKRANMRRPRCRAFSICRRLLRTRRAISPSLLRSC